MQILSLLSSSTLHPLDECEYPSGRAKRDCVPNVIGITKSRLYYSTYGQYHTDWSREGGEKKKREKQNVHVCHTVSLVQAQCAAP